VPKILEICIVSSEFKNIIEFYLVKELYLEAVEQKINKKIRILLSKDL